MSDLINLKGTVAGSRSLPPDVQKALGSCFGLVELAQTVQAVLNDPEVRRQVVVARQIVAALNDPNSGLQQQLRSHAEGFRQVHAALNGMFRSPEAAQIARLLRGLVESGNRKPFSAMPEHFERAQLNLGEMTDVAFIRTDDESGSLAGFLEVQAMGAALPRG